MLLIDDLLMAPFRGLLWIFREIHNAAEQEMASEAENLTAQLSELYLLLESGNISDEEFDQKEAEILDRLEEINQREGNSGDEESSERD
ncbi:MAG: gas vesicle protein GvpG [Desulfarculus sp.]|jgi:tRNA splicing endonuclease|nr:MAG: gas vesicle protein GvpG [Desulfarculus sp.]